MQNFQQAIDITIDEHEKVFFKVSGTHTVYLTGNYLARDDSDQDDSSDEEYDLSPDEDELEHDMDDESDELDDLEDPRITEITSDDELFFFTDDGIRLSDTFHQYLWPGETGLFDVTGILRQIYWGTSPQSGVTT